MIIPFLLFPSFNDHYQGNKSPFVLYIDPLWLTVKDQFDGTRQFLQMITDTYNVGVYVAIYKRTWLKHKQMQKHTLANLHMKTYT